MISFSNKLRQLSVASSLALLLVACGSEQVAETSDTKKVASENSAEKSDYMVVVIRPNNMHFVDLSTDEIVRTCQLPDAVLPGTVVMSPDNLTAYVLAGRFDRILGVDVNNCDLTFDAKFSYDNVRIKSIGSLAVSTDGEEIYTIHNPTKLHSDHYEVLASQFAVYNAKDGIDAKPTRTFDVPRQINIMAAADDGRVYLSGADVFVIDPKTGQVDTAIASHSHNRSNYGQPDVLTVWPLGKVNNEFVRMYTVPKFTDETQNMDTATFMWGYEKVDLATGETEVKDFGVLEQIFFTGMARPQHPDEFYAVLTQLKRHKVSDLSVIKEIDLERTYYVINFSTDGSKLYLGGTYNDIAVYDAESLTKLNNIVLPGGDMSLGTFQVFSLPRDKVVY